MKRIQIFLFVLIFAGCSATGLKVIDMEDREFKISYFVLGDKIFKSDSAFIGFDKKDKRVFGKAGCNRFFCSYEDKGNKISLSENIGATKMMCDPEAMEFEDNFLQNFQGLFEIMKDNNVIVLDNGKMKIYLE